MATTTTTGRAPSTATGKSNRTKSKSAFQKELDEDAKSVVVRPDLLAAITARADDLQALQKRYEKGTALLKQIADEIRRMREQTLPALMDEAGVRLLGLTDAFQLEREEEVYASISKANTPKAVEWLLTNNFGAIVKARITVEVERGDVKILNAARKALRVAHVGFEESGGVHPATLKAFVKEMLGKGKRLPKAITHHIQPVVTVKPIKEKKSKRKGVLV